MAHIYKVVLIVTLVVEFANCVFSFPNFDVQSLIACPSEWKFVNTSDKCIFAQSNLIGTFDANSEFCEKKNSTMLIIDSSEESAEVLKIMKTENIARYWLGGELTSENDQVKWKTIKLSNYTNWSSSARSSQPDYVCLMANSRAVWSSFKCSMKLNMVCQQNTIVQSESGFEIDSFVEKMQEIVNYHRLKLKLKSQNKMASPLCTFYPFSSNSTNLSEEVECSTDTSNQSTDEYLLSDYQRISKNIQKNFRTTEILKGLIDELNNLTHSQEINIGQVKLLVYSNLVLSLIIPIVIILVQLIGFVCKKLRRRRSQKTEQFLIAPTQWPIRCAEVAFE